MNDLQAMMTGALMMALMAHESPFLIEVTPGMGVGGYEPWFFVRGLESDTQLKVTVEVVKS